MRWLVLAAAAVLAAWAATGLEHSRLPDPFAPYGKMPETGASAVAAPAEAKLAAERPAPAGPFILLLLACLCLAALEWKVRRRTASEGRRQAERLAAALRRAVQRANI